MTHATMRPTSETTNDEFVEALCGRTIYREPWNIDNLLPTCRQCASMLNATDNLEIARFEAELAKKEGEK